MDLLLGAVWHLAERLGVDPSVVLGWRESQVTMWTVVADRHERTRLLREMVLVSHAVWAPDKLTELLGEGRAPATEADAAAALARAERVMGMRMKPVTLEELQTRKRKG